MPTAEQTIRHRFAGGWATDFGPAADVTVDPSGGVALPFLVDAENVFFEFDGGPHKIGGTQKINSSAMESGAAVKGAVDYWRNGTGGTATRRRVCHVSTKVLADADDGVFASIITGLTANAVPCYTTFDDLLIISSDASGDVPKSWDQTTAQNLAGTPPRFSFSTSHKNRVFAAGNFSVPSRLYYCVTVNPEDWVGAGAGSIDVSPDDGDMIVGLASYKQDLIIFKGPNKGSVWRLTGSSSSDFALVPLFPDGPGACWHNSIFRFGDDLGWMTPDGTVQGLKDTATYGDFATNSLSRPINKWIKDHLNFSRVRHIWACNDHSVGSVYFTIPVDASSTNNAILQMDYRFDPVRWSLWTAYAGECLARFVDTNKLRRTLMGTSDGFLKRINYLPAKSIDGITGYTAKITTPFLNYGNSMLMKTISAAALGMAPGGNYDCTFGWTRDDNAQQTYSVAQGGSDVLGTASANQFTLGTSQLGGSQFVDRFMSLEEGGEFRSIQYQVTQSGVNQDLELHSISASIKGGALSTENN